MSSTNGYHYSNGVNTPASSSSSYYAETDLDGVGGAVISTTPSELDISSSHSHQQLQSPPPPQSLSSLSPSLPSSSSSSSSPSPLSKAERNDPTKKWVVQKFGGTSVGKFAAAIAEDIVRPSLQKYRVAVVCSARSSKNKLEGTTNRLLRAARAAEHDKSNAYAKIIHTIQEDHLLAASTSIHSAAILSQLEHDIRFECTKLLAFLDATQQIGEISVRSLDTIISKGENLSCRFVAALLRDRGVEARFVDLERAVDGLINGGNGWFGGGGAGKNSFVLQGGGLDQMFYDGVARLLREAVERECAATNAVPVLTGYFGTVQGGLLSQIGRGYTDLCAALVAVGLEASELQVWKEVDGIFTADPRKVPTARLLSEISPAEAAELTFYGSEVIHPFTMEQVIRARIPIRIKNVMNPRGAGTVISPDPVGYLTEQTTSSSSGINNKLGETLTNGNHHHHHHHDPLANDIHKHPTPLFRTRTASLIDPRQRPKRPTAVTVKNNILVLNVHSNKRTLSHGFFANIFLTLDKWRLSVDLISTSEVHVSMALHSESALVSSGRSSTAAGTRGGAGEGEEEKRVIDKDLEGAIRELRQYGTVDLIDGMAILSLVGKQMKRMVGVAGRMFSTLGENGVNIEMISQGASEINISCVIEERDADRAINILHTNLFTFLD
ncbi:Aspartokinase [Agyrium rufum]|nr:Aspartokinase [Agyrium rufum]